MLPRYAATRSWSVLVPRLDWWVSGLDLHSWCLSLSPDRLLDCSHPSVLGLERVSLGESQVCVFIGGVCLSRTLGLPSSYVMLLIGLCQIYRFSCMSICSFHIKTNIVILNCTSDRFPPILPSLVYVADLEELTEKGG